jgi:uncharacterized protein YecE (DUF72 family)
MADHPWYPRMQHVTCDFSYLRLLGKRDVFPDYSQTYSRRDEDLEEWAEVLRSQRGEVSEAFVSISNQSKAHLPCTARKLITLLKNDNHIPELPPAPNAPLTLFD